ncbi:MAG: multicopper oxidase domain-containing protein [Chloroflexota bacterium]
MRRSTHFTVAAVAIAIIIAGCASTSGATWTFAPGGAATPAPAGPSSAPAPSGGSAGAVVGAVEIEAFDLGFTPGAIEVDAPGRYEFTLNNTGTIPHDITFPDGTTSGMIEGGKSATFEVDVPAGGLTFICSIPGHAQAGMEGTVTTRGGGTAGGDDHGGPAPTTDVEADPNAPAPVTYDATAPARLSGDVHDIDLVMTEEEMTVAPGFVQRVWTFNGSVPGPVIRVKVGDTIRIHLRNPATNQLPHSIDFHSSQVAWNDEMTSINPGEEKLYEWTADYAGVWMYHCGTSPALHHIANGMYGMVIVEPAEGLPEVDNEFALVQSEWYLGPQGDITSLDKAAAAAPAPDFVVFNGVANQYLDAPLVVGTGETVRIFVLDAGPNIDSSFHIVGTIFDTVIKEGIALRKGNAGSWGAQAMDLSPAQGGIVEFTTAEDGLYPIVTHAFNFVGRGALGLVQAGDGDPLN